MAFICGNCQERHDTRQEGRACYEGRLATCEWDVQKPYIDYDGCRDYRVEACGAYVIVAEDGSWECANGHSHVPMEIRARRGEDYASDPEEAYVLAAFGTTPLRMDGSGPVPESEMRRPSNFVL